MEQGELQDFKKIMIPLDGSKLSEGALKYGVSIADKFNAEIILVSVYSSKNPDSIFKQRIRETDPELAHEIEKMQIMDLMESYHKVIKKAVTGHKVKVRSLLRDGELSTKSVVSILLDVVEKEKADLVVLSSHGRTGINKLKLGSVAEELLKTIHIPVMCVRE
ncbi:MAG: universal stress protein [Candidatus Methanoperedens sp.]|nr:universal stress protein [Candidatus Methanoperedens sp.]